MLKPSTVLLLLGTLAATAQASFASPLAIVAAENFYGDVAKQIGGDNVAVSSILTNPDQDPHLFEVSPSVARNLSAARFVISNGAGYDPWVAKLLGAARRHDRTSIVVADLAGKKAGDNPHLWYDTAVMLVLARELAAAFATADPAHQADYGQNLARFEQALRPVQAQIAALRSRFAGTPVTATEPVFGYMFEALGLTVRNASFQLAVMNNTEPSASDIVAFEDDLRANRVKALVYNSQTTSPVTRRIQRLARAANVPVVGATETEPAGTPYQTWMLTELNALDRALTK